MKAHEKPPLLCVVFYYCHPTGLPVPWAEGSAPGLRGGHVTCVCFPSHSRQRRRPGQPLSGSDSRAEAGDRCFAHCLLGTDGGPSPASAQMQQGVGGQAGRTVAPVTMEGQGAHEESCRAAAGGDPWKSQKLP